MKHNGNRKPDEILAEIERTRSDMDLTLSAIERRLTPGQLIDQGLEYLRRSGGREFMSNLNTSVKNNPLPVTLVGIGLTWLMVSGRGDSQGLSRTGYAGMDYTGSVDSTTTDYGEGSGAENLKARAGDMAQRTADAAASAEERTAAGMHAARSRVSETAQATRNRLSETASRLSERAQSARESVSSAAQGAREGWSRTSGAARRQVQRARSGYETVLREQPLALGAIGLAIGALLAAATPRTRREDEMMGPAADRLKEQLEQTALDQMEKAKSVLAAAKDAATEEAGRQAESTEGTRAAPSGSSRYRFAQSGSAQSQSTASSAAAPAGSAAEWESIEEPGSHPESARSGAMMSSGARPGADARSRSGEQAFPDGPMSDVEAAAGGEGRDKSVADRK